MAGSKTVYVIIYSAYGHIKTLAESVVEGLRLSGVEAKLWRVAETLPKEVQEKMHIFNFDDIPVISVDDLLAADGFIFGIPTRFGSPPAQMKAFLDATGGLWFKAALDGKVASCFTSTASHHGGSESTIMTFLPWLVHHGISFVPLGPTAPHLGDNSEVMAGSAWGAATIANIDGLRTVSAKEKEMAVYQGKRFGELLTR